MSHELSILFQLAITKHYWLEHVQNWKFQLSAKVMMAPPGGQTITKNLWFVVNSEILKGVKNMFGLCGEFFRVSYMFKPTVQGIIIN